MKIGILGTRGIPNEYGGFEQFAGYLSKGLAGRGHEVFVYSPHHHSYHHKKYGDVGIIHCNDPKYLGTPGQFLYDLHCINDARKRDFDILLHLGYTSDAVWAFRWPKQTVHLVNMDGFEWKRAKYNMLTRGFLRWSESVAATKADHLIADSTGIQTYLAKKYKRQSSFIPYCAEVFTNPDESVLNSFQLKPFAYNLVVARMEPENNIEMIIRGHLESPDKRLVIIGNIENKYGRGLKKKFNNDLTQFFSPVFDQQQLNNIRYYSSIYFHGHSVGGTNPSLLEAMSCGCRIVAHDNVFNKAILGKEGEYFNTKDDITSILNSQIQLKVVEKNRQLNLIKIREIYNPATILSAYEDLMLSLLTSHASRLASDASSHQTEARHS